MQSFIEQYIAQYNRDIIEVSYSTKQYTMNEISTAFGINPFQQETDKLGHLIFIDLVTIANWSHPCLYIFYVNDDEFYIANEQWMPHQDIELITYQ